jgi:hypothetical protein
MRLLFLAIMGLCSCGPQAPGPRAALHQYTEAVAHGDCRRAYALMSAEYRAATARSAFCSAMEENPAEFGETVQALRQVAGEPEVMARLRYGVGDELAFVMEGGQWRIDTPLLDFYRQGTPRESLRSFVRAIERRRYDVVLRFVPHEYRERMSAEGLQELWEGEKRDEIQQLLENLRASLDEPIEETGDRATMQYMERYTCRFVRENGLWLIEDPD